ncbi:hypothetical protein RJT34_32372 [Clitoria ternatea]|uniref:Uncharacterized protein n=1 Tax=Clitoria ternatea TaxID=43366 RepID=A0AAN9EWA3_CLITE
MRWHALNRTQEGFLCHSSNGKAWKCLDELYPDFSGEPCNVRLGLCTDGFNPFGQYGRAYSCWPVILTPYNLLPDICMKREVMFLSILVPGPKNPKANIDVFLQPLVEELSQLWDIGVMTYDASLKNNFMMRAVLIWTINDFPAYGMLSGWSTSGKLACPVCMEHTGGESLLVSGKTTPFFAVSLQSFLLMPKISDGKYRRYFPVNLSDDGSAPAVSLSLNLRLPPSSLTLPPSLPPFPSGGPRSLPPISLAPLSPKPSSLDSVSLSHEAPSTHPGSPSLSFEAPSTRRLSPTTLPSWNTSVVAPPSLLQDPTLGSLIVAAIVLA